MVKPYIFKKRIISASKQYKECFCIWVVGCSASPLLTLWDVGKHCGTLKTSHKPCCVVGYPFGAKWMYANLYKIQSHSAVGLFSSHY